MTLEKEVVLERIFIAIRSASLQFLERVIEAHPNERLYGFMLEHSPEGFSVSGVAATEEGLTQTAQNDRVIQGKTVDQKKLMFRWGGPEDVGYQEPFEAFDEVDGLLKQAAHENLYELYDGTLTQICLKVLKDLDRIGTFGTGPEREQVVTGLYYIGGDNSDDELLEWAKAVNPSSVYQRLAKELALSNVEWKSR